MFDDGGLRTPVHVHAKPTPCSGCVGGKGLVGSTCFSMNLISRNASVESFGERVERLTTPSSATRGAGWRCGAHDGAAKGGLAGLQAGSKIAAGAEGRTKAGVTAKARVRCSAWLGVSFGQRKCCSSGECLISLSGATEWQIRAPRARNMDVRAL